MRTGRMRGSRGLLATELAVLMALLLVVVVALFVYTSRVGRQDQSVSQAAHDAARAASRARSATEAIAIGTEVGNANLVDSGCGSGSVSVDAGSMEPGTWVTVTVTCSRDNSDLGILAVPGTRTVSASASEIIDVFRTAPTAGR